MLLLPKIDETDGKPYISHSQWNAWRAVQSFNLKTKGTYEYMLGYFMDHDFGDEGWAEFGSDVENYITLGEGIEKFTNAERTVLNKVQPAGSIFQKKFNLDFGDFKMIGYWDETDEDYTFIRDYKTASASSKAKYYKDDYYQLDLYAMSALQETGRLPEKLELAIIERKGNCMFGKGRKALTVGTEIWYHERQTSQERMDFLRADIIKTAEEISDHYKVFLKLNGK